MYTFKVLLLHVQAVRIGKDGSVEINGAHLVGDAGAWVVVDHHGNRTVWSNHEFLKTFEPADEQAWAYFRTLNRDN